MADTIEAASGDQDAGQQGPPSYTRNATGLVREVPLWQSMAFNASVAPIGFALAAGLFFVFAAFPRANLVACIAISILLALIVCTTIALLAAAMPRVGGDYLYVSRAVHPAFGLASNLAQFVATALGTAVDAYLLVVIALSPSLRVIGVFTGSHWFDTASTTVLEKGWTFAIAGGLVIALTVLAIAGTKRVLRVVSWLYVTSGISVLIGILIVLFTSRHGFQNSLNAFAQPFTHSTDTYHNTVAAGTKAGIQYPDHGGYSVKSTVGALFPVMGLIAATWYSAYITAEEKGAARRGRQLTSMVGSCAIQGTLILLSVIILLKTTGYDFLAAATNGAFPVSVTPSYNLFAAVAAGGGFIATVLAVGFVLCFPAAAYANLGVAQRVPFAWSFDGILPRKLSYVHPRTHTPVFAILLSGLVALALAAWASFASSFLQDISYATLLGLLPIIPMGIAAAVLPWTRPDLYRDGPADWKIAGVPILPVAGVTTAVIGLALEGIALHFHTAIGIKHVGTAWIVTIATLLAGASTYYVARAVQRRRGVEIELAYKQLPAD